MNELESARQAIEELRYATNLRRYLDILRLTSVASLPSENNLNHLTSFGAWLTNTTIKSKTGWKVS